MGNLVGFVEDLDCGGERGEVGDCDVGEESDMRLLADASSKDLEDCRTYSASN